jgi:hypothetical protein
MPLGSRLWSDRLIASLHLFPATETKQNKIAMHHANKTLLSAFLPFFLLDLPCFSCSSPFAFFVLSFCSHSLSFTYYSFYILYFFNFLWQFSVSVVFLSSYRLVFLLLEVCTFYFYLLSFLYSYSIVLASLPIFSVCVRVSLSCFYHPCFFFFSVWLMSRPV